MDTFKDLAADWQTAPAEHEINNYDDFKIKYRKYTEEYVQSFNKKQLRKKAFFTISTNVLCADMDSSDTKFYNVDRDIYLPLEIAITKWCLLSQKEPTEDDKVARPMKTQVWLINPGEPTRSCINKARDHSQKHKIDFDYGDIENNPYIETDLSKVMKEINNFLTSDRVVFSIQLKHVRQDIGSIKWLRRMSDVKCKPITILSLEDLYVSLSRTFAKPEEGKKIGQGLARHRMGNSITECYNPEIQCIFHQAKAQMDGGETCYCANAITQSYSNVIVGDVSKLIE